MSKAKIIKKDFLIKEYLKNKKTGKEIAKKLKCSFIAVYRYLKKYNIKVRSISESLKGKYSGRKSFGYVDGRASRQDYCKECRKPVSKNTKTGMCKSCSHKGERSYRWKGGRPHCLDCGKVIWARFKRCKSCSRKGKLHWNWIKDRTKLIYPLEFNENLKESIRQKDDYTCQLCKIKEENYYRKLDVHHIDYDKKNCIENNLVTLCGDCNKKVNYNRNYWQEFFSKKIKELLL